METKIYYGQHKVKILATDNDSRASIWIYYVANPDRDAFVAASELRTEAAA